MPQSTFIVVFAVVWLGAAAYVLSVLKLSSRLQQLKREGRALDAPGLPFGIDLARPFDAFRSIGWIVTGRYAKLGDEAAARWAGIARILFLLVGPMVVVMIVGVWVMVLSGISFS